MLSSKYMKGVTCWMALSDSELIYRINNGDEKAFNELIERYQNRVYNTAYRIMGNHEDALDLAQESFIRIYKNLKNFKGRSSFSTWLFRITTNLCLDELRKRKRKPELQEENFQNIYKEEDNPERISLSRELNQLIQEKIDLLAPEQKIVFTLREFQGLSYQEIADITGISIGTVKSRLSRARQNLREDLNKIIGKGGLE